MFRSIKTQKDLKAYVRKVLDEINVCSSIKTFHPNHYPLFMFLFERHYSYPLKFEGLEDIACRKNPVFKNLEIIIIKKNKQGEEIIEPVSVMNTCINRRAKDDLTTAMRSSILPQIIEFKNNNILICTKCGSDEKIHIDHYNPQFVELKNDYIEKCKMKPYMKFKKGLSNIKEFKDEDNDFVIGWNKYHSDNSTLRVLCSSCNLKRKKIK